MKPGSRHDGELRLFMADNSRRSARVDEEPSPRQRRGYRYREPLATMLSRPRIPLICAGFLPTFHTCGSWV
jgi:hypothetical protein